MKEKRALLIIFILVLTHYPLFGDEHNDPQTKKDAKIASVSLYILSADGGWDFAVIYLGGNWSASYYVPPERGKEEGKACDGVIIPNVESEFELAANVYQTCTNDQLRAEIAEGLNLDLKELPIEFKGKALIFISTIDGERRVFERPYNGKFKSAKTQELDDVLISHIRNCKK
jgi:hypothetical protein